VKNKRFSVEQIVGVLGRVEMGVPLAEQQRQEGSSNIEIHRRFISQPAACNILTGQLGSEVVELATRAGHSRR
jgi:hypothetical protein